MSQWSLLRSGDRCRLGLKPVFRRLKKAPEFTLVTIITLALAIGANTAIFAVIDGILLKPLPHRNAERLIALNHTAPGINFADAGTAPFLYFTYHDEARIFDASGIWRARKAVVTALAEPEEVDTVDLSADVLPMLGVSPLLGHWFSEEDDSPNAPETIILTYAYWKMRFGANPAVLGQRQIVDGTPRDIIGVMPQSFTFLNERPSLIRPLRLNRLQTTLGDFSYRGIARLRPGATLAQGTADVARMVPMGVEKFPVGPGFNKRMYEEARFAPNLKPLKDEVVGNIGDSLWVLLGTVGVVLLIACANVANLLMVRAEGREQEFAVRAALGARWFEIARELLAESVLLGLAGGVVGLLIAWIALKVLTASAANLPRSQEIALNPAVLAFTLVASLGAGLLFGLIPVMKYASPRIALLLNAGGRASTSNRRRQLTRDSLAALQVAFALVLLVCSALLTRTFQELRGVNPGFVRPREVQTLHIYIPETSTPDPAAVTRTEQNILDAITAIPGVSSAGFVNVLPMTIKAPINGIWAQDQPEQATRVPKLRRFKFYSPNYLQTMGTPIIAGRDFTWTDTYERLPVAMVSENLAREWWGSPANALGKQIHENPAAPWREVIGVVSDEREDGVDHEAPEIVYFPLLMSKYQGNIERTQRSVSYAIRTPRTGEQQFLQEVRRAVWSVNPELPLAQLSTLQDIYAKSLQRTSFVLVMLAIAGAMALVIGLVGIYGVVAYSVSQRRREIGIRLAVGAPPHGVVAMFMRHALIVAITGIATGSVAALALTRLIQSLLYRVKATDPLAFGAVSSALLLATLLASFVPARRAMQVEPTEVLRD